MSTDISSLLHKFGKTMLGCFGAFLIAVVFLSCGDPVNVSRGNGSETVAVVYGRVVTPEGLPAQGAVLRLIPKDFNPVAQGDVAPENQSIADTNGIFAFSVKIQNDAHYNLEIHYAKTSMSLMHAEIAFENDSANFPMDTVRMPGAVLIRIPAGTPEGYVLMRGTTRTARIDADAVNRGTVLLDSIPSGCIAPIEYSSPSKPENTSILSDTLTIISKNVNVRGNLVLYKDKQSLVTGTWVNTPTSLFVEDSLSPAYEGIRSYRFDYVPDTAYGYAGAGFNLDTWWDGATYDLSRSTKIHVAYRGLAANHGLSIQLRDYNAVSNNVYLGGTSDSFVSGSLPISAFTGVDLSQIREIIFGVSILDKGTGTVWIDDVEVEY
jgi:hypothetical protein